MKRLNIVRYVNSVFSRLFISFLAVLIPIFAVGIAMFNYGKSAIKNEIINSAFSNVAFLKNNMESEVQNIKRLQNELVNDTTLGRFVIENRFMTEYDYYLTIADIQRRLMIMKNSNTFIQDVITYFPGPRFSISADKGYSGFPEEKFNLILESSRRMQYPVMFEGSEIYLAMSFPLNFGYSAEKPDYTVEIRLSEEVIKNYLGKFRNYQGGNTALFDHLNRKWILENQSAVGKNGFMELEDSLVRLQLDEDRVVVIDSRKYYMVTDYSDYLGITFVELDPFDDVFQVTASYVYFIIIYGILSIVIIILYSLYTYRFVNYPIKAVLQSFKRLEEGDLNTSVKLKSSNEFNYLFEGFNKMVLRLNELIDRVYRQEVYAKRAEIKQLQSQINPHFLYNSYFMLHRMIKDEDLENASMLSTYMGKYFQYITRNSSDEVPLYKEIEHARSYAEIQVFRFSEHLKVQFGKLDEKFRDILVPRMILQPILENSIEHGMKFMIEDGLVRVDMESGEAGVCITVEDNGNSASDEKIDELKKLLSEDEKDMETTGIINVHRRLRLYFGNASGLIVRRSPLGGLRFDIVIHPAGGFIRDAGGHDV